MVIAIAGLGNFGYALLHYLDGVLPKKVVLRGFDNDEQLRKHLEREKRHSQLHVEREISSRVEIVHSYDELVKDAEVVVLAVPSQHVYEVVSEMSGYFSKDLILVNTAKALDRETGEPLSRGIEKSLKRSKVKVTQAMLAGGTIASDLFKREPLGIDIGCDDKEALRKLEEIFQSDRLNVFLTTDLEGVEYCASFKNVVSMLSGIVEGMGFSFGSQTHVISLALEEISRLSREKKLAGDYTMSMTSQCFGNDVWMSSLGETRNRMFGVLIGQGKKRSKVEVIMSGPGKTVEGVHTVQVLHKLINGIKGEKKYPLLDALYHVVVLGEKPEMIFERIFSTRREIHS